MPSSKRGNKKGGSVKKNRGEVPKEVPQKLAPLVNVGHGRKPRPDADKPRPEPQRALPVNSDEELALMREVDQIQRQLDYGKLLQIQLDAIDWKHRRVRLPRVSDAAITTQNHTTVTQEAVVPESGTTFTTTTTIPAVAQLPLVPRPPNVPKRNVGAREVLVRQRSDGMVIIVPTKPELISLDLPPVVAPKPPPTKPESNRRNTNKFRKTAEKSARYRRTTKPSGEQTVQQTGPKKPHPPAKPKVPERLLYKRAQISNTDSSYATPDQGAHPKIKGDQDHQGNGAQANTIGYNYSNESFEKYIDEEDGKKPRKVRVFSRAPSSAAEEEIPEELSA